MLSFVVIGLDTHTEPVTVSRVATVAAPFLIALVAGWLAARAWRAPTSLRTGLVVAVVTVGVGIVLRRWVFDLGTSGAFVPVASAYMLATVLGWRLVVALVGRLRA